MQAKLLITFGSDRTCISVVTVNMCNVRQLNNNSMTYLDGFISKVPIIFIDSTDP